MKNTILSITELEELLKAEDYHYIKQERLYIKEFENHNQWTSQEVLNLWDTILEETGLPAKPKEYLDLGTQMTKEFWHKDSKEGRLPKYKMVNGSMRTTYLQWNERIEKAVRWRLGRMYESFIAEYSVLSVIHTDMSDLTLLSSYEIDLVLGVDLVVISQKTNKIAYIHITKDNQWAMSSIERKAKKSPYLMSRVGRKVYWKRRYSDSHLVLLYDAVETDKTTLVNGHYILNRDYVVSMLEDKFAEDIETTNGYSELEQFHDYLVDNKLRKKGIKKMIIKYTFNKRGE